MSPVPHAESSRTWGRCVPATYSGLVTMGTEKQEVEEHFTETERKSTSLCKARCGPVRMMGLR